MRAEVWQAYLDAPAHCVAEILGGELHVMPRPRPRHASVAGRMRSRLRAFDDPEDGEPGGWIILIEPELHLGPVDRPVVPDLAGWRREHVPEDFFEAAAVSLAPDWVCEVLSNRTRAIDRVKKQRIYHRASVAYVWHLDPEAETLEVFRRETTTWTLLHEAEGDERVRAAPFEAIELDLARLWAR
ncbi:MAG: Uma2 family endonuclease [Sandaracinaceae bacterium]|nr:Uma2 family endonuclease [Sandaracinaceae bacterium]